MEDGECRNWLELPPEITSSILHRSWRDLCREPSMWQIIDMSNLGVLNNDLRIMSRHAIDRSQGGLVDINIDYFGSDTLLQFIADSSSNLRRLRLAVGYPIMDDGLAKAFMKFPLLEDLEIPDCSIRGESLKVIGQSCPNLKTLKLKNHWGSRIECDEDALTIAESMPGIRR